MFRENWNRIPGYIRRIFLLLIGIVAVTVVVVISSAIESRRLRSLVGSDDSAAISRLALFTANLVLAYTLGLRHALDADHITAIDNVTRRLIARRPGNPPISVGFWFSLGHSTVVICGTIVVVASVNTALQRGDDIPSEDDVQARLDSFARIGGIIGTSVSMAFLLFIAIANALVLVGLFKDQKKLQQQREDNGDAHGDPEVVEISPQSDISTETVDLEKNSASAPVLTSEPEVKNAIPVKPTTNEGPRGLMYNLLGPFVSAVDRPWRMFPVGLMFGLGFDTAMGIILLAIAGIQTSSPGSVILLPLLFTCGMVLADTLDGLMMLAAYTWAAGSDMRRWKYNVFITLVSLLIAFLVSIFQTLNLASTLLGDAAKGPFWGGLESIDSQLVGVGVISTFIVSWALAWVVGKIKESRTEDRLP